MSLTPLPCFFAFCCALTLIIDGHFSAAVFCTLSNRHCMKEETFREVFEPLQYYGSHSFSLLEIQKQVLQIRKKKKEMEIKGSRV